MIMKTVFLKDICEIIAGQSPPSSTYNQNGEGLPFFQGKADFGELYPTTRMWCNKPQKIAEKGDILISVRAPVGPTNICSQRACIGRGLSAIRSGESVDGKYLLYFLRKHEPEIANQGNGSTFSAITQEDIKRIRIPLPSLEEQGHIVKMLDQADALRQKRKQAIKLLDDYLKSVFLEMFGDPVKNPKEWERIPLSEILLRIESGHSPVCLDRRTVSGEWGVLKLGAVTKCIYIPSENKALPDTEKPNPDIEVKDGDILFSRKNTYDLVAACTYVWKTPPKLMMSDLIFRLVPRDKNTINSIFLQALLSFSSKRKMIQTLAGGAAGSMPNISKAKLLGLKIEVPPLPLQSQFGEIVKKVEALKQKMLSQSEELETEFQALMQKAFKGYL